MIVRRPNGGLRSAWDHLSPCTANGTLCRCSRLTRGTFQPLLTPKEREQEEKTKAFSSSLKPRWGKALGKPNPTGNFQHRRRQQLLPDERDEETPSLAEASSPWSSPARWLRPGLEAAGEVRGWRGQARGHCGDTGDGTRGVPSRRGRSFPPGLGSIGAPQAAAGRPRSPPSAAKMAPASPLPLSPGGWRRRGRGLPDASALPPPGPGRGGR